jgi:tetratricopeptide (TPR) repeat protein
MKISFAFCLIYLTISFSSCNGQQMKVPPSECIELNNKGTEYMMNYTKGEKSGLLKAIDFFNQAVNCEPTYLLAYRNLANAYDRNQDYKKELAIYNKALILSNNHPSIIIQKAEVFEKMNMLDSSKRVYQLARQSFSDSLSIHPHDVNFIGGFILVIALTEGKEAALKELDRRITLNPELKSKMNTDYYFYQNFDKRAYLYQLAQ